MQDWYNKGWLRFIALAWTLLCLAVGLSQYRNGVLRWKKSEIDGLKRSALAVAERIASPKTDGAATGLSEWQSLEAEQNVTVAWDSSPLIDEDPPFDQVRSSQRSSKSHPHEFEWSIEPDGKSRVEMTIAIDFDGSEKRLRVGRVVDAPFDWSSSPLTYHSILWALGLVGCLVSWSTGARLYHRWEHQIERWRKSIDQTPRPMRGIPFPESPTSIKTSAWYSLETIHKRIESELLGAALASERTTKVLDGMLEGVIAVDPSSKILYANPSAIQLLEIQAKPMVGRMFIEAVRNPAICHLVSQALNSERENSRSMHEVELELGAISKRWLRIQAVRLPDEIGSVAIILTINDETRLRRLENLRREFTANVSHELKTPLAAIKAYSETLLMGALDDVSNNRRFVERISEQSARLEALIQDLLKLASIQDSPKLQVDRVHLSTVMRQSVDCYSAIAASKSQPILLKNFDEQLYAQTDREALTTIINNLIGNAVRYTPERGQISIDCSMASDRLRIAVRDTGVGISTEDQERIFERFYRVDKARSSEAGGTGLGLAIVKNLVTVLGGSIQLTSELGKGSTFTVDLPVANSHR